MEQNDTKEILKAINGLSTEVKGVSSRVDGLSAKVDTISTGLQTLSEQVDTKIGVLSEKIDRETVSLSEQISGLANYMDERLTQTEARVVTKEYLDEKLADLRGDLVVLTRKEDHKVVALVELLRDRRVIPEDDARRILGMALFPQL